MICQLNKKFFFCLYINGLICSIHCKSMKKSGVKAMEHGSEIWINQGHLQKHLNLENISDRTQYYSDEFKKMRCEIQECGKY